MADLLREIWPGILVGDEETFFENNTFLSHGVNMNYAVDNDRINLAYKGGRPNIHVNFRTDGTTTLPIFDREDTPDFIEMDNFSTDRMILPKVDLYALPYNKWDSLLADARLALVESIAVRGMWKVGPQSDTAKTPIHVIDSGNPEASDAHKAILRKDIVALRIRLDNQYPGLKDAKWHLVVDNAAYWYLVDNDDVLKAQYAQNAPIGILLSRINGGASKAQGREPIPLEIGNFMLYADNRTPWYKASDSTKFALGASYNSATDFKSAIAYVENKTFCAGLGTTEMFDNLRDPGMQADLASFLTRAYVGPWGSTDANLMHAGAILRRP